MNTPYLVNDSDLVDSNWLFDNRTWLADSSTAWNIYSDMPIAARQQLIRDLNGRGK